MFFILLNKRRYEKYSQNEFMSLWKDGNQLELIDIHQDELYLVLERQTFCLRVQPTFNCNCWHEIIRLWIHITMREAQTVLLLHVESHTT